MATSSPTEPKNQDVDLVMQRLDRILELLEPKSDGPVEGLGRIIELLAPVDRRPKIVKSDLPDAKPFKPKN